MEIAEGASEREWAGGIGWQAEDQVRGGGARLTMDIEAEPDETSDAP